MRLKSVFDLDAQRWNRLSSQLIFISVYEMSRQFLLANSNHILSKIWYDRSRDFKKLENNPVWKK